MAVIETILKKRNPSLMWKLNKVIKINFKDIGIINFICVKDERNEDYFYCEEANHSYHRRLFNKMMLVAFEEQIYSEEEIKTRAKNQIINLEVKKYKILSQLKNIFGVNNKVFSRGVLE